MKNLPLLDIPYNLFRMEVFDLLLVASIPSPLFFFGAIAFKPLMLLYPFLAAGLFFFIRNIKKDKRYGYMQRYTQKLAGELKSVILKKPKIVYG